MFQGFKSVAIVLAVVGTGGATSVPKADETPHGITAHSFATSCQQVLSQNDHDFAAGVSVGDGCGCVANALDQSGDADLLTTSVLLREVVASDSAQEPDWSAIALTIGVDDAILGRILQQTQSAIGTCL